MSGKRPKKEADLKNQNEEQTKGDTLAQNPPAGQQAFPVVALGASAGGLEALEAFFKIVSPTTGAAFTVISHLDPKHPSMMAELIGRYTTMQVHEAIDGIALEPNHVYMIPPNRYLSIFQGKLQLKEQEQPPTVRMPIDTFLRSLAEDRGSSAVAIILSGTGTDGTLGLRALQASGGIVFVQDPDDAKYDGMPRSAIQTGLADYVLPVEEIARQLMTLLERHIAREEESLDETTPDVIQKILMVLRSKTGHDFSLYKKSTMGRRIRRRMNIHNIKDSAGYIHYLREHPDEAELLFKELLINVTSFFRDPEAFDALKKTALPELLRDKPDDYTIRVWVPGCATGEEAYSIAIEILEYAEDTNRDYRFQIFATDMDEASINKARIALFPSNIALDVSEDRLAKFFVTEEHGYRVRKDIREGIVFALQDIAGDPPFTKIDLISCRNVLIYMEPDLQKKVVSLFHYSLNPGGMLFLGSSESIGVRTDLFRTVDNKWKFFQAKPARGKEALLREGFTFWPTDRTQVKDHVPRPAKKDDLEAFAHSALLSECAPPAIIVDIKGDILYIYGDMTKYLTPSPGHAGLNIEQMAREGLRFSMRSALMAAASHQRKAVYRNVRVNVNGSEMIDLTVVPLPRAEDEDVLFLFTFQEVLKEREATGDQSEGEKIDKGRMLELENELLYTRESLQATAEKAQAANEELKSANEELQSSNEELHSTNEELETSREELQSVNEELITLNAELRSKMEQLSWSESDMKNLLDSTEIATIFLDRDFHVKRFNASATRVVSLIPSDVGRPIDDVTLKIDFPPLSEHARDVMDHLNRFETEVKTKDDAWFSMRIVPYKSLENVIDGVVMTFVDITESKRAAAEREVFFENIVQTVRDPLLVLDENLKVVMANNAFLEFFQVRREDTQGGMIRNLGGHEWNIPALTKLLSDVLETGKVFEGFKVEADFPWIGLRTLLVNARKIKGIGAEGRPLILLAMENVTGSPSQEINEISA